MKVELVACGKQDRTKHRPKIYGELVKRQQQEKTGWRIFDEVQKRERNGKRAWHEAYKIKSRFCLFVTLCSRWCADGEAFYFVSLDKFIFFFAV